MNSYKHNIDFLLSNSPEAQRKGYKSSDEGSTLPFSSLSFQTNEFVSMSIYALSPSLYPSLPPVLERAPSSGPSSPRASEPNGLLESTSSGMHSGERPESPTDNLVSPPTEGYEPIRKSPKRHSPLPYERREEYLVMWMKTLRAQTYCTVLSRTADIPDKKNFLCTFNNTCKKEIKGKGNLRYSPWTVLTFAEGISSGTFEGLKKRREMRCER